MLVLLFIIAKYPFLLGAVGCVVDIENPVTLARKVMEETPHCLLVGSGALKFARKINFPILSDPLELVTHDSVCKSFVVCEGMRLTAANIITHISNSG